MARFTSFLSPMRFIVSPLATLAFKLGDVGVTGLKTGWVRCRHVAGRGGLGLGGVIAYFVDRFRYYSPGMFICVCASIQILSTTEVFSIHPRLANCTCIIAKYNHKPYLAPIYEQNMYNLRKARLRCVSMAHIDAHVSR